MRIFAIVALLVLAACSPQDGELICIKAHDQLIPYNPATGGGNYTVKVCDEYRPWNTKLKGIT